MNKISRKFHKGFTLMEVMVSVSIFAIIVTVGIGALLTINDAYRKSQTQRQAIDSLTYMMESMSRRIRTATTWSGTYYGQSSNAFKFVDQDGITVIYYWDVNSKLLATITDPNPNPAIPSSPPDYNLTPQNVHISNTLPNSATLPGGGVTFTPMQNGSTGQPYLQINIGGYVTNGKEVTPFSFQTGVSKRASG